MRIIKRIALVFLILLVIVAGAIFYAFKIEPYRIVLDSYDLNQKTETSQHLKIVQISDIHIKENFTHKNLEKVVSMINAQNPDIVIFTGDLYDNYSTYNEDEDVILTLQKIEARYDKIAIWGNRDYGGGASRHYEDIMEQSGFRVLDNENTVVSFNHRDILITGLDDSLLGTPEMPDTSNFDDADYRILLTHEPDTVEDYRNERYDIALSGHSHGGQFDIPFLPFLNEQAIDTTALASIYKGGMYQVNEDGIKQIFVNTGIGTTHISARFGVPPKITLFNVYID